MFHGLWFLLPLLFLGKFFWIVVLALLVWAAVRHFGSASRSRSLPFNGPTPFYRPNVPPTAPSAMDILRQRYARGEIDAVTFDQMRERIEATGGAEQR